MGSVARCVAVCKIHTDFACAASHITDTRSYTSLERVHLSHTTTPCSVGTYSLNTHASTLVRQQHAARVHGDAIVYAHPSYSRPVQRLVRRLYLLLLSCCVHRIVVLLHRLQLLPRVVRSRLPKLLLLPLRLRLRWHLLWCKRHLRRHLLWPRRHLRRHMRLDKLIVMRGMLVPTQNIMRPILHLVIHFMQHALMLLLLLRLHVLWLPILLLRLHLLWLPILLLRLHLLWLFILLRRRRRRHQPQMIRLMLILLLLMLLLRLSILRRHYPQLLLLLFLLMLLIPLLHLMLLILLMPLLILLLLLLLLSLVVPVFSTLPSILRSFIHALRLSRFLPFGAVPLLAFWHHCFRPVEKAWLFSPLAASVLPSASVRRVVPRAALRVEFPNDEPSDHTQEHDPPRNGPDSCGVHSVLSSVSGYLSAVLPVTVVSSFNSVRACRRDAQSPSVAAYTHCCG